MAVFFSPADYFQVVCVSCPSPKNSDHRVFRHPFIESTLLLKDDLIITDVGFISFPHLLINWLFTFILQQRRSIF